MIVGRKFAVNVVAQILFTMTQQAQGMRMEMTNIGAVKFALIVACVVVACAYENRF